MRMKLTLLQHTNREKENSFSIYLIQFIRWPGAKSSLTIQETRYGAARSCSQSIFQFSFKNAIYLPHTTNHLILEYHEFSVLKRKK